MHSVFCHRVISMWMAVWRARMSSVQWCAQDTESVGRYVSVAVDFLTAMKDRLYHIGSHFALQVGKCYGMYTVFQKMVPP